MSDEVENSVIAEDPEAAGESVPARPAEAGAIVQGTVIKIKPFGAIVELPDRSQGLIYISHISNRYVQDIEDFLSVGDTVTVKVLSIEEETGKISLSIKDAEQQSPNRYSRGDGESSGQGMTFEEKFKDFVKASNERQAGLNKRNKRR